MKTPFETGYTKYMSIPEVIKPSVKIRMLGMVEKSEDGCWNWTGERKSKGYGIISVLNKRMAAHRVSYMVFTGDIQPNMFICHKCDNPKCLNPDHLYQGHHRDNMNDLAKHGKRTASLDTSEVNAIRSLSIHGYSNAQISRMQKIHHDAVAQIILGRRYKDVPVEITLGPFPLPKNISKGRIHQRIRLQIPDQEVIEMRKLRKLGMWANDIADKFKKNRTATRRAIVGETHKHIPSPVRNGRHKNLIDNTNHGYIDLNFRIYVEMKRLLTTET